MAWVSLGVSALGYVGGRGFRGFSVLCGVVGFIRFAGRLQPTLRAGGLGVCWV